MDNLQGIAGSIDTGATDPDNSRALVVFNLTDKPLSGVAVFRADMAWPKDTPLPPVVISELDGEAMPSALTDWGEGPDKKGRVDRRQVSFALRFAVRDVPAQGWRTYIAAYTEAPGLELADALPSETPGLVVVETLRHDGDLPPVGRLSVSGPGVETPGYSPARESPCGTADVVKVADATSSAPEGLSQPQE